MEAEEIEKAIIETLVIENKQSVGIAVNKILKHYHKEQTQKARPLLSEKVEKGFECTAFELFNKHSFKMSHSNGDLVITENGFDYIIKSLMELLRDNFSQPLEQSGEVESKLRELLIKYEKKSWIYVRSRDNKEIEDKVDNFIKKHMPLTLSNKSPEQSREDLLTEIKMLRANLASRDFDLSMGVGNKVESKKQFYEYAESLGIKINDSQRLMMLAKSTPPKKEQVEEEERGEE